MIFDTGTTFECCAKYEVYPHVICWRPSREVEKIVKMFFSLWLPWETFKFLTLNKIQSLPKIRHWNVSPYKDIACCYQTLLLLYWVSNFCNYDGQYAYLSDRISRLNTRWHNHSIHVLSSLPQIRNPILFLLWHSQIP